MGQSRKRKNAQSSEPMADYERQAGPRKRKSLRQQDLKDLTHKTLGNTRHHQPVTQLVLARLERDPATRTSQRTHVRGILLKGLARSNELRQPITPAVRVDGRENQNGPTRQLRPRPSAGTMTGRQASIPAIESPTTLPTDTWSEPDEEGQWVKLRTPPTEIAREDPDWVHEKIHYLMPNV